MLNKILYFFIALVVITTVLKIFTVPQMSTVPDDGMVASSKADLITVISPLPESVLVSPIQIKGSARGNWFFEASFPVVLTNWDGLIIAEGYATAQGEWMTTEFVPFTATLSFVSPYKIGDPEFMKNGSLILRKDNPSGLPEHDDALEIPIRFAP